MKEYIIHLEPQSSFETTLHSDTLFGAICWGIRMLFGENKLLETLEAFSTDPPFFLSSAFPFRKNRYFLPMPVMEPIAHAVLEQFLDKEKTERSYHSTKTGKIEIIDKYKLFNKISHIEAPYFKKFLKAQNQAELFQDYMDNMLKEPDFSLMHTVQKNSLDRLTLSTGGSGNTFYASETSYREKYGLFFLLRCRDIEDTIMPVLRFLEDSGLGANARTGKNWFKIARIDEQSLFGNDDGDEDSFVTLSRYIKNETLDIGKSYYKTVSVRSKVESRLEFAGEDIWKSRVTYVCAGSVITPLNKSNCYGRLAPVKTIHGKTIYQYGFAFPVWIKSGGKNEH